MCRRRRCDGGPQARTETWAWCEHEEANGSTSAADLARLFAEGPSASAATGLVRSRARIFYVLRVSSERADVERQQTYIRSAHPEHELLSDVDLPHIRGDRNLRSTSV